MRFPDHSCKWIYEMTNRYTIETVDGIDIIKGPKHRHFPTIVPKKYLLHLVEILDKAYEDGRSDYKQELRDFLGISDEVVDAITSHREMDHGE